MGGSPSVDVEAAEVAWRAAIDLSGAASATFGPHLRNTRLAGDGDEGVTLTGGAALYAMGGELSFGGAVVAEALSIAMGFGVALIAVGTAVAIWGVYELYRENC